MYIICFSQNILINPFEKKINEHSPQRRI